MTTQKKSFDPMQPISFMVDESRTYRMDAAADEAAALAAKAVADKAAADKVIADKAAADKIAADKVEADRIARMTENERKLLGEVMEKKDAIKKLNDQLASTTGTLTELQTKLKAFEGIDPEKVRTLLATAKTAEEIELEKKGEWDRLKARMNEEHATALKAKDDALAVVNGTVSTLRTTIDDLTVGTAFNGSKFITEELVLPAPKARVVFGQHFEIEEGQVVAYDKPRGTKERTKLIDGTGSLLPFDAAMKKLVEADPDRDRLLKSKLAPGAGSGGGSDTRGGGISTNTGELTGRDRMAASLRANPLKMAGAK